MTALGHAVSKLIDKAKAIIPTLPESREDIYQKLRFDEAFFVDFSNSEANKAKMRDSLLARFKYLIDKTSGMGQIVDNWYTIKELEDYLAELGAIPYA